MPTSILLPPPSPFAPTDVLRSGSPRNPAEASATFPQPEPGTRNLEPETPPTFPPPRPRRDRWTPFLVRKARPTVFTAELITDILEEIERHGLSDSSAAALHGVSASTMAKWKEENPQIIEFLQEARATFEHEQVHRVEVFKRKDGQSDPYCSRWLLERGNPEKWGPPSARRKCSEPETPSNDGQHETRNSPRSEVSRGPAHAGETASKKPKPGTPEFWATVEEEPLPRPLTKCIMTPGRTKFYSTMHLVSMPYRPDIDPNQPTVHPTPEQRQAELESLYQLQERYFARPKHQRLAYLHQVYEQQFGKVLSPEVRAATDALVGGAAPASRNPIGS